MGEEAYIKAIKLGNYKHIGIAIDDNMVVYTNLMADGTVKPRWVVDRGFVENAEVFSIHSKSDKDYLVVDMVVSNGIGYHRVNSLNLAKKVYEYVTGDKVDSGQVIHHLQGQFICLRHHIVKLEKAEHDALCGIQPNMSVEEFFLLHLMTPKQYYGILKPNIEAVLRWMLENKKYSGLVSVGDICLYETRLDSVDNWQSLIVIK